MKLLTATLSGLVLLSLGACSTLSTTPLPQKLRVPEALLAPCLKPGLEGKTNRDLALAYRKRGDALDACNADKDAIRRWNDAP